MSRISKWKLFGLCASMTGAISLIGAGVVANAEMNDPRVAVKTVLGATQPSSDEDLSIKDVVANSMPAMVSITNTSVQDVRDYFGGNSDLFNQFFGDFFGYGYGYGYGNGNGYGTPRQQESVSAGSGIIVGETDDDILIASNNHVVEGATELTVSFIDETAVNAEVIGTDPGEDVALIKVAKKDIGSDTLDKIAVIPIGKSSDVALGEGVIVIGNALGYGQSASHGIISALDRTIQTLNESTYEIEELGGLIQTDAAINAGNSGGAMLNMKGELIGINVAKGGSSVENMGYAIPIDTAEPILSDIANGTHTETSETAPTEESTIEAGDGDAYLGVSITTVTQDYADYYGIPTGAYVQSVEKGSAAEKAGIRAGDIITAVDGTTVTSASDLKNLISHYTKGDSAEITIVCFGMGQMGPMGNGGSEGNSYNTTTVTVDFGSLTEDEAA